MDVLTGIKTLISSIPQNISLNKSIEILLNTYNLGMASFLSYTDYQNEIDVNFNHEKIITDQKKLDTWKNWVFEVYGSFNFDSEKSINEEEFNLGFDIDIDIELLLCGT